MPDLAERRAAWMAPTYKSFFANPLHIVRGEGLKLWDADGREYLDCYNNVVSVGHCHPHVVEALSKQAATLNTHTRYLHENVVDLAERLSAKLPDPIEVCVFTCTGTEANDLATLIAREVTGNQGMAVSECSYHGVSELVRTLSTGSYPVENRPDWLAVLEPPNRYRGPFGYDDTNAGAKYLEMAIEQLDALEQRGHRLAALMVDLVWDSNGPLAAPVDYVQGLCAEVRRRGGLIIADEVQAGYCRSGRNWWCSDNFEITPDIITCGKPMGGGHPLALMATTREIAQRYAKRYHYFNTYGGNPVSTAVGNAVIDVIENENLLQNVDQTGAYFEGELRKLADRQPLIGDVQGCGLFWGLDMVRDPDSKAPFDDDQMRRLGSLIVEQGVITGTSGRYDQILKLRPPLPFSREHADFAVQAIDVALQKF